jgi:uncharacterized protein YdeI (YjbR/CyaY-like superfamily)
MPSPGEPRFFASPAEFRAWLEANHAKSAELVVGFYKKGSGKPSMTWSESVDEALCFGWIDGVRRSIDAERYTIRFTPRKPVSIWSNVNIAKVEMLLREGRMRPAGLVAWERRDPERSGVYAFERATPAEFDPESLRRFKHAREAWTFFQKQPPGYRRLATHYVTSAKRPETRERRLSMLIEHSAKGERLPRTLSAKPKY